MSRQPKRWTEESKAIGRPRYYTDRRIQSTIYIDPVLMDKVDKIVLEKRRAGETTASRSQLYHEAMSSFLKQK